MKYTFKDLRNLYEELKYEECISYAIELLKLYPYNFNIHEVYVKSLILCAREEEAREYIDNIKLNFTPTLHRDKFIINFYRFCSDYEKTLPLVLNNINILNIQTIQELRRHLVYLTETGQDSTNISNVIKEHYKYAKKNSYKPKKNDINGLFFANEVNETDNKTLIVSGNPRSGTTALGELLELSETVVMLVEHFNPSFGYHPNMFQDKYIFFEGDSDNPRLKRNLALRNKLNKAKYIGDKRPRFFLGWSITQENYLAENIKIVHIVRSIYNVAYSYKMRAMNVNDDWLSNRDVYAACMEANAVNQHTLNALNNTKYSKSIFVVEYEEFFASIDNFKEIFSLLDIEVDEILEAKMKVFLRGSKSVYEKNRKLTKIDLDIIKNTFDFETHNKILDKAIIKSNK